MGVVITLTPSQITCPEPHLFHEVGIDGVLEGVGGTEGERLRAGLLEKARAKPANQRLTSPI